MKFYFNNGAATASYAEPIYKGSCGDNSSPKYQNDSIILKNNATVQRLNTNKISSLSNTNPPVCDGKFYRRINTMD